MTEFGYTEPRVYTPPLRELTPETSHGFAVIQFAERILGVELLPWQKWWLIHALELKPNGAYRFKTVLLMVARQNGKTHLVKILILWKLFVQKAALVIGAAQSLGDAEDVWEEILTQAQNTPSLAKRLGKTTHVNGGKKMRTSYGGIYMVETLQRDAGRGKTSDLVFLDELREHKTRVAWNALSATTLVPPNSQNLCASNAGDSQSVVLNTLQDQATRAIETDRTVNSSVGLFEWSADPELAVEDHHGWRQANPALGYTLTYESIQSAKDSMDEAGFKTEHLCQRVKTLAVGILPMEKWRACLDLDSRFAGPVHLGLDVAWDRSAATLAVAGYDEAGDRRVEVVATRAGLDWVLPWLKERLDQPDGWWDGRIALQIRGAPVSSMVESLREAKIYVEEWGGPDLAIATGQFYDFVVAGKIRHMGQPVLDAAVQVARSKVSGDAWWFDRKNSPLDISPLIAATAATWLMDQDPEEVQTSAYSDPDYEMLVL